MRLVDLSAPIVALDEDAKALASWQAKDRPHLACPSVAWADSPRSTVDCPAVGGKGG